MAHHNGSVAVARDRWRVWERLVVGDEVAYIWIWVCPSGAARRGRLVVEGERRWGRPATTVVSA